SLDQAMVALMLTLPSEAYLSEQAEEVQVEAIHHSREAVRLALARALVDDLWRLYDRYDHTQEYHPTANAIARRSLKNVALEYLMLLDSEKVIKACEAQYHHANNMTDAMAAL